MKHILPILSAALIFCSCTEHFITSSDYRSKVDEDLANKVSALNGKFNPQQALSCCADEKEQEALKFLYAYMPLGDIADYDYTLYINGIRSAFTAQEEMPWGASVPEDVFRHFVLPLRVNNENLDGCREVFYQELKERVKGLSMYDAVLEVNHWCHEKVIYTPSDARTSAPLASVRTAYGRCGEESVFTVAALRSVGIPARQVYTPRWAHTDDNHAWVEAWVDGTWHYLGACEPEAKLDVAWFSSTALRALLMHTKVFGRYEGPEDIISVTDCYTEINVTANYAPTQKITVTVLDGDGNKVEGAKVEFKIYNYAEFYSAISSLTDASGSASATFGKGDILVWASFGEKFGYRKVSVGKDGPEVSVLLDKVPGNAFSDMIDIIPPSEGTAVVTLTPEEIEANKLRLAHEDSIRTAYTNTFATRKDAEKLGYLTETERINKYLQASRGNWAEISDYISQLNTNTIRTGLSLLDQVSEKDLRDTPSAVLMDHFSHYQTASSDDLRLRYVLNPRVANELLSPYKGYFMRLAYGGAFGMKESFLPIDIIHIAKQIKILDGYNPQQIPLTPIGTYKLMAADRQSRDIMFVAACRTADIPARIEEVSGKLQYYADGQWNDVDLDSASGSESVSVSPKGKLALEYDGKGFLDNPKYETHFTIARISDESIHTLNFTDKEGREGSMTWKGIFEKPVELDCGYYMLTSGTRMASGKVISHISFFTIEEGKTTKAQLIMREDPRDLQVIGAMDAEANFSLILSEDAAKVAGSDVKSGNSRDVGSPIVSATSTILNCTGRGFFVLGFLKPNHEPSNHAIRSLFESVPARPTILLYSTTDEYQQFLSGGFPSAPSGIHFGIDQDNAILDAIRREMKLTSVQYPIFVIADTFGRIVYLSQGYNIGTAEQLNRLASL